MKALTSTRLSLLLLASALLALAVYVYRTDHTRNYPHRPSQSTRNVHFLDESVRDNNMCVESQGYPDEPSEWWQWACLIERYMVTVDYPCRKMIGRPWKVCLDEPFNVTAPCLVYSFGINNEWDFDDMMTGTFKCMVHSFDPSMGKKDFQRNARNKFYDLGLGWRNTDTYSPRRDRYVRKQQYWRMRTLKKIMEELGHTNVTLDVLKMDIELSEWPVIAQILSEGSILRRVRQLMVEWHITYGDTPPRKGFKQLYDSLSQLREKGFHAFKNSRYGQLRVVNDPASYHMQCEMSYVNVNFRK